MTNPFLEYLPWRATIGDMLDERRYSLDWLDGEVVRGTVKVWTTGDAIILAEVRRYPTGAEDVHGLVAAGNLDAIVNDLIPKAEQFGRDCGCIGAVIESREGWAKVLTSHGYAPHQQTIRKDF